jgi:RES domain
VSEDPAQRSYWRVGHTGAPLAFVPLEICEYSHRFDDLRHRFRTVYIAELAETCFRETLADFRPKLSAIQRFQREMGDDAAQELAAQSITAAWRREHVLAPLRLKLDGPIYDLTDIAQRRSIEDRHSGLLLEHGMQHLDLHEITTGRRVVTQTIAGDLYDEGVAAIRFPSHLDGNPCIAVFEGRGVLVHQGPVVALTDPAPQQLVDVAAAWRLALAPAAAVSQGPRTR